jgi:hypothetical protein
MNTFVVINTTACQSTNCIVAYPVSLSMPTCFQRTLHSYLHHFYTKTSKGGGVLCSEARGAICIVLKVPTVLKYLIRQADLYGVCVCVCVCVLVVVKTLDIIPYSVCV